ncbi:MAG: AAA family ATPase [Candidatus Bathyarchaeia archaeon]|jgi:hypothetical protein
METTNTPAVKDQKEFQEKLDVIKAGIKAGREAKQAEAFALPKDEEVTPTPGEQPEPPKLPKPVFDFSIESFDKMLAGFLRDESFFKLFRKWMKPIYFTPIVSMPFEIHRFVYEKAVEHYDAFGGLIEKHALDDAIVEKLKTMEREFSKLSERDRENATKPWREISAKLYSLNLESSLKYIKARMIHFLKIQASREEDLIYGKETLGWTLFDDSKILEHSKRVAEIAGIGKEDQCRKIRTCKDVDETLSSEADDWIVRGLIAKKDINIWYSPPGVGKSHLIWLLGNAVNDGKECLGIDITQTPVTYLDLENTEDVRRHIKRLLGAGKMGLITLDDDIEIPNIDSAPEKFEEFILTLPIGLILIDLFSMITDETKFAESKWEVAPIIKVLKRLCKKGYTFLLIFHSLKADPKTIKGPQELLGRAGHVVSIYNVSEVGEEKELEEIDPNKPRTLFVGTGANLKSRHKKSIYWLKADMNEESEQKGFRRMGSPTDSILEKIQIALRGYLKNKEISEDSADYFPNQTVFIELTRSLLGCSEKKARAYIKQGNGRYWTERQTGTNFQYYPKR